MRRIILSATIWLLLLGNLAYFVWAQGVLAPLGFGKSDQSEPQRLSRQISPERIILLPAEGAKGAAVPAASSSTSAPLADEPAKTLAASSPPTAAAIAQLHQTPAAAPVLVGAASATDKAATPAPPNPSPANPTAPSASSANGPAQCLQTPALEPKALVDVRRTLETQWPAGSWKISSVSKAGRWMVYMGKYPNKAALEKKQSELKTLKVSHHVVKNPDLAPGISLGEFDSQAKANQALQAAAKSGVRTAKVIQEASGKVSHVAVISSFTPKQQPLLDMLQTKLGAALVSCDKGAAR